MTNRFYHPRGSDLPDDDDLVDAAVRQALCGAAGNVGRLLTALAEDDTVVEAAAHPDLDPATRTRRLRRAAAALQSCWFAFSPPVGPAMRSQHRAAFATLRKLVEGVEYEEVPACE
jgi:hypothetical protein